MTEIPSRINLADQLEIQTTATDKLTVTKDQLHWIDSDTVIPTAIVDSHNGQFQFGNCIGQSSKIEKITNSDMLGKLDDDDKLNRVMYGAILRILAGQQGSVKRFVNSPKNLDIYYDGLSSGARVYFADMGTTKTESGKELRTFLKIGLCSSKNQEPRIMGVFSGERERVKK